MLEKVLVNLADWIDLVIKYIEVQVGKIMLNL